MPPTASTPAAPSTRPSGGPARPPAAASGFNTTIDPKKLALQYWPWLVAALIVGIALGVGTHLTLRRVAPVYQGQVWFEFGAAITRDVQTETTLGGGGAAEMERFIGTQMQRLTSDDLLRRAVMEPSVRDTEWRRQFIGPTGEMDVIEAALELREKVTVRMVPDTNFVQMRVAMRRPGDAARIANAIKDVYESDLRQQRSRMEADTLEALTQRLRTAQEERRLIEERRQRLFEEADVETLNEQQTTYAQQIKQLLPVMVGTQNQLSLLTDRLDHFEEQLSAPAGATYPEEVTSAVEQDPRVQQIQQRLSDLRLSRRAALEQFGENHRELKRIDRFIEAAKIRLAEEKESLKEQMFEQQMALLRNRIRASEVTEAETQEELEEARNRLKDVNRLRQTLNTLERDSNLLATEIQDVQNKIAEQQSINQRRASTRLTSVQAADIPTRLSFPRLIIIVPLVTFLCLALTGGLILLRELLEQRVRGPSDIAMIPRTRVLGVLPDLDEDPSRPEHAETATRDAPTGVIAECVRQLRTDVVKRLGDGKTLLVVGGMPGSGGSTVLLNLAFSLAAAERRVLLIDANMRRPKLHEILGVDAGPGVVEALRNERSLDEVAHGVPGEPNLTLVPVGEDPRSEAARERLLSSTVDRLLREGGEQFDIVLIDAPPAIVSSDAVNLASKCDGTLLVVRAFGEKRGLVQRLRNQFEGVGAQLMGVVINGVRGTSGGYFRSNFRATHAYQNPRRERGRFGGRGSAPEDENAEARLHRNGEYDGEEKGDVGRNQE